jgi:hypothetical protein|nr:MAG TPA: hypothetical protein [Caudoviricetes sp.]
MTRIDAFEAQKIAKESANINGAMEQIFSAIRSTAKLGKGFVKIEGLAYNGLSEAEQQVCINELIELSYRLVKTSKSLTIIWKEELSFLPNCRVITNENK